MNDEKFVQEYAYVEDYSLYEKFDYKKLDEEENNRGVISIQIININEKEDEEYRNVLVAAE